MSNAQHTPGPWKAMERRDARGNPCGYAVWPDIERKYIGEKRGNQICATPDGTTPEAAANARLIAAAPEMLELILQFRAKHHLEFYLKSQNKCGCEACTKARALIDKISTP